MSMQPVPAQPRRPRDEPKVDSMPAWYAIVAVALTVALALAGESWQSKAFLGAIWLFLVPSHDIYKPRRADRAFVFGLMLVFAVGFIQVFRWSGPVWGCLLFGASLGWMCTGIGFFHTAAALTRSRFKWLRDRGQRFHELREEHEFQVARDVAVPAILRHVKHPDAGSRRSLRKRLISRVWLTRGWQYAINVLPWTAAELAKHSADLAAFLGLKEEQVVVTRSADKEGVALMNLNLVDTLTSQDWTPVPDTSIKVPLPFGHAADGGTVDMEFIDLHWIIGGTTGSGKSMLLHQVCAKAVASNDALLVILDAAKGGRDYKVWRPHSWLWADDLDACRRALAFLEQFVDQRYREDDGEGSWKPTPDAPQIVVLADEGSNLNDDAKCKQSLKHLVRKARGAGVSFVFGIQRPHNEVFDTNILTNINGRVMLRVDTQQAVTMMLPGYKVDPQFLNLGGYFLARWPGSGEPVYGRTWFMRPGVVRSFAESHQATELGPPMGRPQSLIPAIGTLPPPSKGQVESVEGVAADSDSQVELDEFAGPVLKVLGEAVGALIQSEIQRLSGLGNPRTVKKAAGRLVALGFATEHTSTSWSVTELGRAHLERQEVKA